MWNIDLKKTQQYYGMLVTLREAHAWKEEQGRKTKNLNVVDVFSVQE
jgi:hypothetical protein